MSGSAKVTVRPTFSRGPPTLTRLWSTPRVRAKTSVGAVLPRCASAGLKKKIPDSKSHAARVPHNINSRGGCRVGPVTRSHAEY